MNSFDLRPLLREQVTVVFFSSVYWKPIQQINERFFSQAPPDSIYIPKTSKQQNPAVPSHCLATESAFLYWQAVSLNIDMLSGLIRKQKWLNAKERVKLPVNNKGRSCFCFVSEPCTGAKVKVSQGRGWVTAWVSGRLFRESERSNRVTDTTAVCGIKAGWLGRAANGSRSVRIHSERTLY